MSGFIDVCSMFKVGHTPVVFSPKRLIFVVLYNDLISFFIFQSGVRACPKNVSEQFRTKCCVKVAAGLTLDTTDIFLIKM